MNDAEVEAELSVGDISYCTISVIDGKVAFESNFTNYADLINIVYSIRYTDFVLQSILENTTEEEKNNILIALKDMINRNSKAFVSPLSISYPEQ